ncbi:MAG: tRNA (adenosine(37)-N6)-threonylcarbamoyltransferase complex dimerization subunit type 1 TsaB [Candidatus Marinimicrobia bacterium]|nr:tRNA (adenosine(37)-N6)-threonylcarbamoyltransferase complex dimerization subunit type 1 TsaB [Candidatus Neomarinimicrobiota bacterium]
MNILAIESASTICGAALFLNNELVELDEINQPRVHGERLPLVVHNLLSNHSIDVADLDGIAVSSGPGSYTGLRIGMSLAKGLAMAGNLPLIPVPTLEVMNKGITKEGVYWILLHSHKNMVFAQQFNSGKPDSEIECETLDPKKYFPRFGFNLDSICKPGDYEIAPMSAQNVGELALKNFDKWANSELSHIIPNYVTSFNVG